MKLHVMVYQYDQIKHKIQHVCALVAFPNVKVTAEFSGIHDTFFHQTPALGYYGHRNWGHLCWELRAAKGSLFDAWGESECGHACFTPCQAFLPFWFLPSSFFFHFFSETSTSVSLVLGVTSTGFCVGLQNGMGCPACCCR